MIINSLLIAFLQKEKRREFKFELEIEEEEREKKSYHFTEMSDLQNRKKIKCERNNTLHFKPYITKINYLAINIIYIVKVNEMC